MGIRQNSLGCTQNTIWDQSCWTSANPVQSVSAPRGGKRLPENLDADRMAKLLEIPGEGPEAEPERIEIQTGLSDGLNIEVTSGLEEGQEVVQRPPRDVFG